MGVLPDWMIERDIKITPFSQGQKRDGLISYGLSSMGYDVRLGYKGKVFTDVYGTTIDPKNFDPKALVEFDLTREHGWVNDQGGRPDFCTFCHKELGQEDFKDYERILDETCPKSPKPDHFLIPPNSFMLGESLEHFDIPRDVLCLVVGKSTYARCGLIVNVTPGEPEWPGHWTIEISNTTRCYAKVYAGEGIMQCMFLRTDGYGEATTKAVAAHLNEHRDDEPFRTLLALDDAMKSATCRVSYKDKKGKYQDQAGLTLPKVDGGAK